MTPTWVVLIGVVATPLVMYLVYRQSKKVDKNSARAVDDAHDLNVLRTILDEREKEVQGLRSDRQDDRQELRDFRDEVRRLEGVVDELIDVKRERDEYRRERDECRGEVARLIQKYEGRNGD